MTKKNGIRLVGLVVGRVWSCGAFPYWVVLDGEKVVAKGRKLGGPAEVGDKVPERWIYEEVPVKVLHSRKKTLQTAIARAKKLDRRSGEAWQAVLNG